MTDRTKKSPIEEATAELGSLVSDTHKVTVKQYANLRGVRDQAYNNSKPVKTIAEGFSLLVKRIKDSRNV